MIARGILEVLTYRSPFENWIALKRKLRGLRGDHAAFDLNSILHSAKHLDPCKLIDRLRRYETVLHNAGGWEDLDFVGKNVLELGSGPLLGWAPVACFLGCRRYVCVEAHFDSAVVTAWPIRTRYFLPVYRQLRAIFGSRMGLFEFERVLSESVFCHRTTLENAPLEPDSFDLVISNSVLEHVRAEQLAVFFERLYTVTTQGGRHLHCIDFSNHRRTVDPFDGLYSEPRDAVRARFPALNLMRPSELLQLFNRAGLDGWFVPYVRIETHEAGAITSEWQSFGDDDVLSVVGFLVGQRGR